MKNALFILSALAIGGIASCKKYNPQLGDPPTAADATFTYQESAANANIIEFSSTNQDIMCLWDFGNGLTAKGNKVTATYPNMGNYEVTLTVFNKGGSASSTQTITIAQSDPTLLNSPLIVDLTGGAAGPGSKTWVIDSLSSGHIGVGSPGLNWPNWWEAGPMDKVGVGMYDDRYTFYLTNFQFDMVTTDGQAYVHNSLAAQFPGSYENATDYTAPHPDQLGEIWTIVEDTDTTLILSGNTWLGMYTGVHEWRILTLNDTCMYLQYDHHEGGLHWYVKLIPEGFVAGGGSSSGSGNGTNTLPLDFESGTIDVTEFGGGPALQVVTNPDANGINTSANVCEFTHGYETWAGFFFDMNGFLDFSTNTNIEFKMYAPTTGTVRVKIENSQNSNVEFYETDVNITQAGTWELITADLSQAPGAYSYDRIVLFPGWGTTTPDVYYVDDITQN